MKYRIRAVRPNKYLVEKKGWFFWHTFLSYPLQHFEDSICALRFKTVSDARLALEEALRKEQKELGHISQPPVYLEM